MTGTESLMEARIASDEPCACDRYPYCGCGRAGMVPDRASYWLGRAAAALDCAVQCCGTDDATEIDAMERRCDELAAKLKEAGR